MLHLQTETGLLLFLSQGLVKIFVPVVFCLLYCRLRGVQDSAEAAFANILNTIEDENREPAPKSLHDWLLCCRYWKESYPFIYLSPYRFRLDAAEAVIWSL